MHKTTHECRRETITPESDLICRMYVSIALMSSKTGFVVLNNKEQSPSRTFFKIEFNRQNMIFRIEQIAKCYHGYSLSPLSLSTLEFPRKRKNAAFATRGLFSRPFLLLVSR